jgi:hypothetical protein
MQDGQCRVVKYPDHVEVQSIDYMMTGDDWLCWDYFFTDEEECFNAADYRLDDDNFVLDVYGDPVRAGDKVALIEAFNTHGHRLKRGEVHRIDEDARGKYLVLIVESTIEQFGSYTKRVYNSSRTVMRMPTCECI